nr:uncharacterized protein LOC122271980 [Parasteatoda tepidariorum]
MLQSDDLSEEVIENESRYEDYDAVFKEWEDSKIIELVPESEIGEASHYLPHRGVFKEHSTTRVRPVFDASSHEKGFPSLNDCLEKGPNLLEEIPTLLMKFRMDNIGVVSDIEKAFLQISVVKEDRDFLRFLLWEDFKRKKFKIFRHNRVVFGLTHSPFLLSAVINAIPEAGSLDIKDTADSLKKPFYVDNCITSVPSQHKLEKFIQESTQLLHSACFDLRGWEYSHDNSKVEKPTHVLGLHWDKQQDSIFCDLNNIKEVKPILTRICVLSTVHNIFDPLGILCPFTLPPKIIVQHVDS